MKLILKKLPEANIQAEFFRLCKNNNINCILEYKYEHSKFDAVIYNDEKEILAIIEFKSYKTKKLPRYNTKQIEKYKQYNIPVYLITRLEDVYSEFKKIINEIKYFKL